MNRRTILQFLGLAPVAGLFSSKAEAVSDPDPYGGRVPGEVRIFRLLERHEQERKSWEESKLFTVSADMEPMTADELFKASINAGLRLVGNLELEPLPPAPKGIEKLAQVIRASTKTPDILERATVTVLDKDGSVWSEMRDDTSLLFTDGGRTLASLIMFAAREALVKRGYPRGSQVYLQNGEGLIEKQLKTLGSVHVSFFYYGPPPYPPDQIHTFNYEKNAWEPWRR